MPLPLKKREIERERERERERWVIDQKFKLAVSFDAEMKCYLTSHREFRNC